MGLLTQIKTSKLAALTQAVLYLLVPIFCMPAFAEDEPLRLYEQKIKAGLVYNLLKYTAWPEVAGKEKNKINLCLFGDNPFDGYLAPLDGRTANRAIISLVHIDSLDRTAACDAIIIHKAEEEKLVALLGILSGKKVLTISDIEQFSHQGGMIELANEGQKVSLYINNNVVTKAGLTMDPSMLKLARVVE